MTRPASPTPGGTTRPSTTSVRTRTGGPTGRRRTRRNLADPGDVDAGLWAGVRGSTECSTPVEQAEDLGVVLVQLEQPVAGRPRRRSTASGRHPHDKPAALTPMRAWCALAAEMATCVRPSPDGDPGCRPAGATTGPTVISPSWPYVVGEGLEVSYGGAVRALRGVSLDAGRVVAGAGEQRCRQVDPVAGRVRQPQRGGRCRRLGHDQLRRPAPRRPLAGRHRRRWRGAGPRGPPGLHPPDRGREPPHRGFSRRDRAAKARTRARVSSCSRCWHDRRQSVPGCFPAGSSRCWPSPGR